MGIANKRLRVRGLMLTIFFVGLVESTCADSMLYRFVPNESQVFQSGGIGGIGATYTIEGSLGLEVDFDANAASFVDVEATLLAESGLAVFDGASLDSFFNLTGAAGTVVNATTLAFTTDKSNSLIRTAIGFYVKNDSIDLVTMLFNPAYRILHHELGFNVTIDIRELKVEIKRVVRCK